MIILNARLYQASGDEVYKTHAKEIYEGIQDLKISEESGLSAPGRYLSPYSAVAMGAETDDYSTLSSHNYLMFAQLLLYKITGETKYINESDIVLDFLESHLPGKWQVSVRNNELSDCDPACGSGETCILNQCVSDGIYDGILHHWMDGKIACDKDPEYFCSGCNLQTLYVMWYRQNML